tara:strand:+ start:918 stop:1427 length:510 start_codon:yes stop_codon:yes gene_type:complete
MHGQKNPMFDSYDDNPIVKAYELRVKLIKKLWAKGQVTHAGRSGTSLIIKSKTPKDTLKKLLANELKYWEGNWDNGVVFLAAETHFNKKVVKFLEKRETGRKTDIVEKEIEEEIKEKQEQLKSRQEKATAKGEGAGAEPEETKEEDLSNLEEEKGSDDITSRFRISPWK